eukprot:1268263-Pleurochrysis_carterae.AAC.5
MHGIVNLLIRGHELVDRWTIALDPRLLQLLQPTSSKIVIPQSSSGKNLDCLIVQRSVLRWRASSEQRARAAQRQRRLKHQKGLLL